METYHTQSCGSPHLSSFKHGEEYATQEEELAIKIRDQDNNSEIRDKIWDKISLQWNYL
jgi:hypothetical protein